MPGFLAGWVASGFWGAIGANLLVGTVFACIGLGVKKANNIAGCLVQCIPGTLFVFYIWHVRGGAGWLIFAIFTAVVALIIIIAEAIPLILGVVAGRLSKEAGPVTEESLRETAESLNASLPTMMDANTRQDAYVAGPGLKLTTLFTLVTLSVNDPGMDNVKTEMYNALLGVVKTNPAFSHHRDAGVILAFAYNDKNGAPFATYEFGPNEYR